MSRDGFERAYGDRWQDLEAQLGHLEAGHRDIVLGDFPARYRQVCQHLALARARGYGADLEGRLNHLVLRGHQQLYRERAVGWRGAVRLVTTTFPRSVRAHARLFWISALLLVLPGLAMGVAITLEPDLVYSVMSQEQAHELESMYRNADSRKAARPAQSDFLMFGYYIFNNVSIAFRTFAGGVLGGLGTVFFLVWNSIFLGSAAAYIGVRGHGGNFYPFVVGHGAFELTGIVLAGAAGLRLGAAVLMPGSKRRFAALKDAAHSMLPMIFGTALFLVLAAFVEAYWSPRPTAPAVRYWVGGALWALVAAYLLLAGRGGEVRE